MKKSTKFSIALVGTTLLGGNSVADTTTPPADNPFAQKPQNVANDSFLSKLGIPADLRVTRGATLRETRASGGSKPATGTSGTPSTTTGTTSTTTGTTAATTGTTGTTPSTTASGTPGQPSTTGTTTGASGAPTVIMSRLEFAGLKERYTIGETVNLSVHLTPEQSGATNKVDLWVAVTVPNVPGFLFFTGTAQAPQFSAEPRSFLPAVKVEDSSQGVLEFLIPPGMEGTYTFYALLVERDKNPLESRDYDRSNLLIQVATVGS